MTFSMHVYKVLYYFHMPQKYITAERGQLN